MSNDKTSSLPDLSTLKDKLFAEFEKMSQMLQEEKSAFEEQMARRKNELDSEVKAKLAELKAGKEELENAKNQLQQKRDDFAREIEKKTQALEQMKSEIEQEKKAHANEVEQEQVKARSKEVMELQEVETRIQEIEAKTKELEKGNKELTLRKLTLESELKNLKQVYKAEEEQQFQKMAALKNELEVLENEIEQKLFLTSDGAPPDYTKKNRELIITTVTGDTYRGNINIGSKERLSDMFTKVKIPFIVMYDVNFKGEKKATVIINKQNIVSIRPLDPPHISL